MIHSFKLNNFYSFAKSARVSFEVNDKAPRNLGYAKTALGARVSKIEAVVGANASGKTNLLKVLPFLKWLIVDSFISGPDFPVQIKPFMFGKYRKLPTELSVEFELNEQIYNYKFSLSQGRIAYEELKQKSKSKKRFTYKSLFKRKWNDKSRKYDFNDENFKLTKGFEDALRPNASVVAVGSRTNHKLSKDIANYWLKINTNVDEIGWVGDFSPSSKFSLHDEAIAFFRNNPKLKNKAEKFLHKFDTGLEKFEIRKVDSQVGQYLDVYGVHQYRGHKEEIPFKYESSGTKQLTIILRKVLATLDFGGIAVIDELDSSLHSEIVLGLVDLFMDKNTNPTNAQLIFSTHSLLILSKLDKYQIIFTEKGKDGLTETWRLNEISDVRSDDNFYAKYIAGAYGGIPKIK